MRYFATFVLLSLAACGAGPVQAPAPLTAPAAQPPKALRCLSGRAAEGFRQEVDAKRAALSPKDRALVENVVRRLAAATRSDLFDWPPEVEVVTMGQVNAQATCLDEGGKHVPLVLVAKELLSEVAQGSEARLAMVLGHEFGHLILGHAAESGLKGFKFFAERAFSREHEFEADAFGAKAVVAAGYDYAEAMAGEAKFYELEQRRGQATTQWDTHPTMPERLARLDQAGATIWRASMSFQAGVAMLLGERYLEAEASFERVTREFPKSGEAWANLGYARLMRYADGLSPENIEARDIGQPALGAFHRRIDLRSLSGIRERGGPDARLWASAVEALRLAARLGPEDPIPSSSLSVAQLLAPEGVNKDEASRLAAMAMTINLAVPGPADVKLAVAVNTAVAFDAAGRTEESRQVLDHAGKFYRFITENGSKPDPAYNLIQGLSLARSGDPSEASGFLKEYLSVAPRGSPWWKRAYIAQRRLSGEADADAEPPVEIAPIRKARPAVTITFSDRKQVTLAEPFKDAVARLGARAVAGAVPEQKTPLVRADYPERGAGLIGADTVMAVVLSGWRAPPIEVPERGPGGRSATVRIGMALADVEAVLGPAAGTAPLFDPASVYLVYPNLNLAFSTEAGNLSEIVMVQFP